MNKFVVLLLLIPYSFFLSPASCVAQNLKVISATNQDWSGGMVRPNHEPNSGTDYTICLSSTNKDIVFDSLYIAGSLAVKINPPNGYIQTDNINNTYIIRAASSSTSAVPARHFTGAGLVIYTYKGKKYSVPIASFVGLPPRNNLQ